MVMAGYLSYVLKPGDVSRKIRPVNVERCSGFVVISTRIAGH